MTYRLLQLAVILAALAACSDAVVKLSLEMEKCAEMLIRMMASETNAMYRDLFTKIMKHIQNGALGDAQRLIRGVPEEDRNIAIKKYLVGDCIPMKSCLDCPVEL